MPLVKRRETYCFCVSPCSLILFAARLGYGDTSNHYPLGRTVCIRHVSFDLLKQGSPAYALGDLICLFLNFFLCKPLVVNSVCCPLGLWRYFESLPTGTDGMYSPCLVRSPQARFPRVCARRSHLLVLEFLPVSAHAFVYFLFVFLF